MPGSRRSSPRSRSATRRERDGSSRPGRGATGRHRRSAPACSRTRRVSPASTYGHDAERHRDDRRHPRCRRDDHDRRRHRDDPGNRPRAHRYRCRRRAHRGSRRHRRRDDRRARHGRRGRDGPARPDVRRARASHPGSGAEACCRGSDAGRRDRPRGDRPGDGDHPGREPDARRPADGDHPGREPDARRPADAGRRGPAADAAHARREPARRTGCCPPSGCAGRAWGRPGAGPDVRREPRDGPRALTVRRSRRGPPVRRAPASARARPAPRGAGRDGPTWDGVRPRRAPGLRGCSRPRGRASWPGRGPASRLRRTWIRTTRAGVARRGLPPSTTRTSRTRPAH